jgi:hypothetical protein
VRPVRSPLLPVVVTAALVGAVGCGGGGDDPETSAAKDDIEPQAQQKAESLVLQLPDFPAGWRAAQSEDNGEDGGEFRQCAGLDFSRFTTTGEAESQDFSKGQSAQAASQASVFASPEEAQAAIAEFVSRIADPHTEECFKDAMEKELQGEDSGQDVKVGSVDIGELRFTPPAVDEGRIWQIAIPIEVQGFSPTAYLELSVLREGDAVATVETIDLPSPFDAALRDDLLAKVAARMSGSTGVTSTGATTPQPTPTQAPTPPDAISDGIWQYGVDFQAGTYVAPGGKACYWATLKDTNTNHIINNGGSAGQQLQQLGSNTPFFETDGCGTWTKRD